MRLSFLRQITWNKVGRALAALVAVLLLAGAGFLVYVAVSPPAGVPILEYHMITDETDEESYGYAVPPADFAAQLDYLKSEGYTTITLMDFLRAKKGKQELPEKPIILTFDDGYEDNYTEMLPLLEERGMTGVVFMVTNDIGQKGYLTWDELKDMAAYGIEIGSHTANHLPLTTLDRDKQMEEIKLSKLLMEWNGLPTVFTLSYPMGDYNTAIPVYLRQNQYLAAVTGDAGLNTFETNPYLLQRTNIPHPRFGLLEFRLRLYKAALWTKLHIRQHD